MAEREEDFTEDVEKFVDRIVGSIVIDGTKHTVHHFDHILIEDRLAVYANTHPSTLLHDTYWQWLRIVAPTLPEKPPPKTTVDFMTRWLRRAGIVSPPAGDAEAAGSSSSASSPSTGT